MRGDRFSVLEVYSILFSLVMETKLAIRKMHPIYVLYAPVTSDQNWEDGFHHVFV